MIFQEEGGGAFDRGSKVLTGFKAELEVGGSGVHGVDNREA